MPSAIFVENVGKQYRLGQIHASTLREAISNTVRGRRTHPDQTIWALHDVSFEVQPGEVVGLIGRNGSGKSTLLKVLSRITFPTKGRVRTMGRVAALLEVGTGFHEELTGRENIFLNGSILGMKRREIARKLDEIVAFADIEQFLDTPIKRYSSGMRLRLGFAVAAHLEPDVLLVDEVLAVGDVGFQKKCLQAMDNLHDGGRTVIFVSHNLAAVENLCPRAIWIDRGRVRADGEARSIIQDYLATFADAQRKAADLRHVAHRRGTGEVRFTRVELLDTDGSGSPVVRCGGPMRMRLHYEATRRVQHPHFGVEVFTNLGTLVTALNTWTAGYNIESIGPGEGTLDVFVPAVNLVPDRYYLSLWIASMGPKYDHVELCATLDVETADVYGSGRAVDGRFGVMILPCRWQHQQGPAAASPHSDGSASAVANAS
jgi:lipopolysaccharide transport system ATP-binding protein